MTDWTEQFREIYKIQKMWASYESPAVKWMQEQQKQMERLFNPLNSSISKLLEAQQKQMEKLLEPIKSSILEVVVRQQKQMEEILRPQKDIEKYFNQMFLEAKKITEVIAVSSKKYLPINIPKSFEFNLIDVTGIKKLSDSLADINFNFNRDGTISIEDEMFSTEEIQNKVDEIIEEESLNIKKDPIENTINIFIKLAINTKESIIKILILGLIINFLSHNVIEPLKNKIKNDINKNKKIIIKKIQNKKFANEIYSLNFRFVTVKILNVRIKNSRKSAKIGELHLGDVVYIIKKKKNWSLVLYKNDEAEIKGWVFSRYLNKFKSRKTHKEIKRSKRTPEEETAYLLRSPKNAARLTEAIEEIEAGRAKERKLLD